MPRKHLCLHSARPNSMFHETWLRVSQAEESALAVREHDTKALGMRSLPSCDQRRGESSPFSYGLSKCQPPPSSCISQRTCSLFTHTLICHSSPPSPQAQAFAELSEVVIVSFITTVFISAIGAKCHMREEGIQYLDSESFMLHTFTGIDFL